MERMGMEHFVQIEMTFGGVSFKNRTQNKAAFGNFTFQRINSN